MSNGFIFLFRAVKDSSLWQSSEPFDSRSAWLDLVMSASFDQKIINLDAIEITLARGELAKSTLTLADNWHWSRGKVRRFLESLKRQDMITTRPAPGNRTIIIHITNYEKWQEKGVEMLQFTAALPGQPTGQPTGQPQSLKPANPNRSNRPTPIVNKALFYNAMCTCTNDKPANPNQPNRPTVFDQTGQPTGQPTGHKEYTTTREVYDLVVNWQPYPVTAAVAGRNQIQKLNPKYDSEQIRDVFASWVLDFKTWATTADDIDPKRLDGLFVDWCRKRNRPEQEIKPNGKQTSNTGGNYRPTSSDLTIDEIAGIGREPADNPTSH